MRKLHGLEYTQFITSVDFFYGLRTDFEKRDDN